MDMKKLLESMSRLENKKSMKSAEKDPTGPKFTGYWKGTDPRTPGNKMVGGGAEEYDESILKDLSKGPRAKTIEEELAEAYAQFNEEDLGVEPKRPARKGSRHHRGHEPHPRYKTVKTDEGYDTRDAYELEDPKHPDFKNNWEEYKAKHPDAKLADFISFLRSRKTKTNEAGNPAQQAAIAIAMKKAGKKPKNESAMSEKDIELQDYRSMSHKQFQTAYGMTKTEWINKNKALVIQNPKIKQALGLEEGAEEDPVVARVVKQMRPGLKNLDLSNEAFLYFAYELGKQRARDAWSDYLPAIRAAYEHGLHEDRARAEHRKKALAQWKEDHFGSSEGFEEHYGNDLDYQDLAQQRWDRDEQDIYENGYYGPVEARWIVTLSDDEGQHLQTYHKKFPSLSAAKKAFKDTPYASDFKYKAVGKATTDESRGHTILANKLKDIERAKKFATGELEVPTPQERQAQLKQLEKAKKTAEDIQPMANPQAGQNPTANPVNQQAVNQALNTIKTSTGSMASPQDIEKGLTDLAQGTANSLQVKKMKDVVTPLAVAATSGDPMANQDLKNLAVRSKQIQQKQKAQQQKT